MKESIRLMNRIAVDWEEIAPSSASGDSTATIDPARTNAALCRRLTSRRMVKSRAMKNGCAVKRIPSNAWATEIQNAMPPLCVPYGAAP